MSVEEKNFIKSFNEKERAIFFQYLKRKSNEKNWMGNGYGSGNYLLNYQNIYRKKSKIENLPSLNKFMKNLLGEDERKNMKENEEFKNRVIFFILEIK